MAVESPNRSNDLAGQHGKSDLERETYGKDPYVGNGPEEHHVVADKLARKLSARQVQMIAIGRASHPCHHYTSRFHEQKTKFYPQEAPLEPASSSGPASPLQPEARVPCSLPISSLASLSF
jgi:hypothetical protein